MSLARESRWIYTTHGPGDVKMAHYDITFTLHQILEPTNDPGWLLLNGATLSTTTYAKLFNLFGYTYGGSGANFTLPDLTEGRTPITKGLANFTSVGASGGEINHTLASGELPSHAHGHTFAWISSGHGHSVSGGLSSDGSHTHTVSGAVSDGTIVTKNGTGTQTVYSTTTTATTGGESAPHSHSGSISPNPTTSGVTWSGSVDSTLQVAGSTVSTPGSAHNNMQPYIVIGGWLVKYK